MPCQICKTIFNNMPCKKNITSDPILTKNTVFALNDENCRNLIRVHGILLGHCPCEDCIIKTICNLPCEDYYFRVRREDKIIRWKRMENI